MLLILKGALKN